MADREWWQVETSSEVPVPEGKDLLNREAAVSLARALAEESNQPLMVVKYIRREIKTLQRVISVSEEDLPIGP